MSSKLSKAKRKCKGAWCKLRKGFSGGAKDLTQTLLTGVAAASVIAFLFSYTMWLRYTSTFAEATGYLFFFVTIFIMAMYAGIYSYMHKESFTTIYMTFMTMVALSILFAGFYLPLGATYSNYVVPFTLIAAALANFPLLWRQNKTGTQTFRLLLGSIAPIMLALITMPTFSGAIAGEIYGAGVIPAVTGNDVFTSIWNTLISDPLMAAVVAVMSIGSMALILGKSRGRRGYAYYGLGWVAVAGVPTLILLGLLAGFIPPNPTALNYLVTVFGSSGIAQFVYMFEMASIIGVALAITAAGVSLVESIE